MAGVEKLAEVAKEKARLAKELESKKLDLKLKQEHLEKAIRQGDPIGTKDISVKYAAERVEKINDQLKRLN